MCTREERLQRRDVLERRTVTQWHDDDEVVFRSPRPDGQTQVYRRKKTSPRRELEMRTREERLQRRGVLENRTATQWHGKGSKAKGGGKRIEALLGHLNQ